MPVTPSLPAAACRRSALRAAMITSAPCAFANSAVARPMPEDPPTTTIFWPASILRSFIFRIFSALHHAAPAATNPLWFHDGKRLCPAKPYARGLLYPAQAQAPRQPGDVDAAE